MRRRSALRSGFLTGFATIVLGGSAAVAGAVLAHKFGRNTRTDGLLAAYGVYIVLAAAAQAFRNVVVPDLTRAAAERRLGAETLAYAAAFASLTVPIVILVALLSRQFGDLITGKLPAEAASIAGRALIWLVPAAFLQLFASLAASALAATDSYGVAALGYSLGGIANVALFVALSDRGGVVALAWSVAFGAFVALAVQLAGLLRRRALRGSRAARLDLRFRLWRLLEGSSLPLALQLFYVVAIRAAGGLGVGRVTSLSYAYLLAATLVAATAVALGVISSAPLTRRGLDPSTAAEHVIHSAWISLALVGAAAGVFSLVGGRIVGLVLGGAFRGAVGRELGHLVVYLAPWMVASIAFSVTFPLVFVVGRRRVLFPLAVGSILLHAGVTIAFRAAWGLPGIAFALAVSTLVVLVVLTASISPRMLVLTALGLGRLSLIVGVVAVFAFGSPSLVLGPVGAAAAGLVLYALLLAVLRRHGLEDAWAYVRALH